MNKLDLETKNIIDNNIEKIGSIFPNVIVETENGQSIDFDLLKQELSSILIEGNKEKYQLTWPGKKEAIVNANTPTTKTLRPIKEKSVDFDNTENIYIEGDNLEVLKILQESYLNKIKCIYIDPPYNTGNDFIYNDKFSKTKEEELEESGQIDEYRNRMISNSQSNGKYHSDWLSMMYPRLKLARNLLTEDGVMFISIDDNEQHNLKHLGLQLFGENNIEELIWQKQGNDDKSIFSGINTIRNDHEMIYVFYKNRSITKINRPAEVPTFKNEYGNVDNDFRGNWMSAELGKSDNRTNPNGKNYYTIKSPAGIEWTRQWHYSNSEMDELIKSNKVYWGKNNDSVPRLKKFVSEKVYKIPSSLLLTKGSTKVGKENLLQLFGEEIFSYPKPNILINYLIELASNKDSIILDFFSGSGVSATQVIEINKNDNGKRKFIMVQLPEKCDEKSEAYKAGYETICEIGQERIRRAGNKIKEETNADIDYGFRVYKVDSSNMTDVYHQPNDLKQTELRLFEENIKEDRNGEDLLTQVIIDLGLTLDLKIENKNINNNNVYVVADNSLIACFDNNININMIDEIVKFNPLKVVFRDSSFASDNDRINVEEKFKKYSPETEVSII